MAIPKNFRNALDILPHLARCAKQREKITYQDLGAQIGVPPLYMGQPLDVLRDQILLKHNLPRLDALVVNKETGEVGDSFYAEGFGTISMAQRREILESERDRVFNYERDWEVVIRNLRRHYLGEE